MTDPTVSVLAGDYVTISVTIGASAASLADLVSAELTSRGYGRTKVLQMGILSNQPDAATDREPIYFGDSQNQFGYLGTGLERIFPAIGGGGIYVKRAGGSDVSAVIECFMRIVP